MRVAILVVMFALAGCHGVDITVFTTPDGSTGGVTGTGGTGGTPAPPDAGVQGTPCRGPQDCSPGTWTCAKRDCRDPQGVCQPRPLFCDPNPAPVCGCDHVTYWNDCVRQQNGGPPASPGECGSNAAPCDAAGDCRAPGASCAHLVPAPVGCVAAASGTCWVTPTDCLPSNDPRNWALCPPPPNGPGGNPPPPQCRSTCDALQSGRTYVLLPPGAPCAP